MKSTKVVVGRRQGKMTVVKKSKVSAIAKGKPTSMQTLAKAIKRLQRKVNGEHEYLTCQYGVDGAQVIQPAYIYLLNYYQGMTPIFGVSADDLDANKIIHKSVGMDIHVTLENFVNNEENTIGFTAFLVSLKDDIGSAFNAGTGALTLTANQTHYSVQGMTLLNKKMFNIHKVKRFTLTNFNQNLNTAAAQSQYGADRRFYWRLRINKTIQNPVGNWKNLSSGNDPSKTYYVLIFNNNTDADFENPQVTISAIHTFQTV